MHMPPPPPRPKRNRNSVHLTLADMDSDRDLDADPEMSMDEALADELAGDHTYGTHQQRPAWAKGKYAELWHANWSANGNKIVCAECSTQIRLTSADTAGLEIYPPGHSYKEQTRPHIDHHNPDWVDRAATISQVIAHASPKLNQAQEKKLLDWAFNAPPLRILHRKCNLVRKKPKPGGAVNAAFATVAKGISAALPVVLLALAVWR